MASTQPVPTNTNREEVPDRFRHRTDSTRLGNAVGTRVRFPAVLPRQQTGGEGGGVLLRRVLHPDPTTNSRAQVADELELLPSPPAVLPGKAELNRGPPLHSGSYDASTGDSQ